MTKSPPISQLLTEYEPQINQLRAILFRSLISFALGFAFGLIFYQKIIVGLLSLFNLKNINIVLTSPTQFINLAFGVSIITGLLFLSPVLIFHLLRFLEPALTKHEHKLLKNLIPFSVLLFFFGCFFGGYIEQFVVSLYSQTTSEFLLSNIWDIQEFISQVLIMSFTMGIVFQLPVLLTILIRLKVVSKQLVSGKRRFVYLGLAIFAILLPPTDVLSLVLIITPLFLLFEGTLLLNR